MGLIEGLCSDIKTGGNEIMNRYKKYCPNVWVAECDDKQEKGSTIILETKYGKENEHIVHNLVGYTGTKDDTKYCYSIIRADGFNSQERAKNRAAKRETWANSADNKSDEYYNKSNKDKDFLSLGEPIKVGHHSERRHRKMFEDAHNNMGKSIEMQDKAQDHRSKIEYWERMAKKIDLSMPESIDFFTQQLKGAEEYHQILKDNPEQRPHSMALQYSNKNVKELKKKVETAGKLWGEQAEVKPKEEPKEKKNPFDNFEGLFWAFGTGQFKEGMESVGLKETDLDKIISIGAGGYILKTRRDAFKQVMEVTK